jgi:hypothetical protein
MDLSLDWLWAGLPHAVWFDQFVDKAHFALIINGAVLLLALFVAPATFNLLDPIHGPDLKTFCIGMAVVSLPIWGVIFGIRGWTASRGRRRAVGEDGPTELWDRWLDGPV